MYDLFRPPNEDYFVLKQADQCLCSHCLGTCSCRSTYCNWSHEQYMTVCVLYGWIPTKTGVLAIVQADHRLLISAKLFSSFSYTGRFASDLIGNFRRQSFSPPHKLISVVVLMLESYGYIMQLRRTETLS